jgi:hypothetical protein
MSVLLEPGGSTTALHCRNGMVREMLHEHATGLSDICVWGRLTKYEITIFFFKIWHFSSLHSGIAFADGGVSELVLARDFGDCKMSTETEARLARGMVSKRIGSPYVSGRTRAWLKTRNPNFSRDFRDNLISIFALNKEALGGNSTVAFMRRCEYGLFCFRQVAPLSLRRGRAFCKE